MRIHLLIFIVLTSCVSTGAKNAKARAADRDKVQKELGEVSLKADRAELEELRKDIPPEKKKANDELALFLNLMGQGNENPQVVREKFQTLMRTTRTEFREKSTKLREDYRSDETKRREEFLSGQQKKRDRFNRRKHDTKESHEFFNEQDKDRQSFFADERSRRQSFESELSAESKDFDAYMRDKQKEFDEQYRLYSKKFSEKPKPKSAVTGDDFQKLNEAPSTRMGTED